MGRLWEGLSYWLAWVSFCGATVAEPASLRPQPKLSSRMWSALIPSIPALVVTISLGLLLLLAQYPSLGPHQPRTPMAIPIPSKASLSLAPLRPSLRRTTQRASSLPHLCEGALYIRSHKTMSEKFGRRVNLKLKRGAAFYVSYKLASPPEVYLPFLLLMDVSPFMLCCICPFFCVYLVCP